MIFFKKIQLSEKTKMVLRIIILLILISFPFIFKRKNVKTDHVKKSKPSLSALFVDKYIRRKKITSCYKKKGDKKTAATKRD